MRVSMYAFASWGREGEREGGRRRKRRRGSIAHVVEF